MTLNTRTCRADGRSNTGRRAWTVVPAPEAPGETEVEWSVLVSEFYLGLRFFHPPHDEGNKLETTGLRALREPLAKLISSGGLAVTTRDLLRRQALCLGALTHEVWELEEGPEGREVGPHHVDLALRALARLMKKVGVVAGQPPKIGSGEPVGWSRRTAEYLDQLGSGLAESLMPRIEGGLAAECSSLFHELVSGLLVGKPRHDFRGEIAGQLLSAYLERLRSLSERNGLDENVMGVLRRSALLLGMLTHRLWRMDSPSVPGEVETVNAVGPKLLDWARDAFGYLAREARRQQRRGTGVRSRDLHLQVDDPCPLCQP